MGAAAAVSGLAEGRVTGDAELTLYTLSPWAKPRPARSLHRTTSWWLVRSYLLLKMPGCQSVVRPFPPTKLGDSAAIALVANQRGEAQASGRGRWRLPP